MPTPQEMCEADGGRWNADMTCSSAADLAVEAAEAEAQALREEIAALRTQLGLADDGDVGASITELQNTVAMLRQQAANAEAERLAAEQKAAEEAAAALAATAAKLYAGIGAAPLVSTGDGRRSAAYNADDTGITVTHDPDLTTAGDTAVVTELSADDDTMVADNHGWSGMRYIDDAGGDEFEAVVYSDVKAPTMGRKFGSAAAVTDDGAYEYQLADGALANATLVANPARVDITSVTRTAGTETFNLPDPNTNNEQYITRSGSFHGVSGTYSCDTGAARTDPCTAAVAAEGLTLSTNWTFTPSSAEARVMDSADTMYASYGWWLMKGANDGPFIASAFVDYVGGDGSAELAGGIDALNGSATYVGGAAGKYALASSTGGINDVGHFTARATLEADFTNNTTATAISGTIDYFMGADDMSRDWSVKLNGSAIADAGSFGDATAGTEWTIGGSAAADSGMWSGQFYDAGTDLVPGAATGTFYTEYGTAGRMVGAFGVNEQE